MRLALAALALVASACAGYNFGSVAECEALCATARACGFLPSALGWSETDDLELAEADCQRRCWNTPASDPNAADITGCFDEGESAPGARWCEDEDEERFALFSPCAQVDRCFAKEQPGHQLYTEAAVTVQLMGFEEYDQVVVDAADDGPQGVSALYPAFAGIPGCVFDGVCDADADEDPDCTGQPCRPRSCAPAMCGREYCKALSCVGDECEAMWSDGAPVAAPICDTALCRYGKPSISDTCAELAAQKIEVAIRELERPPAVEVFMDARAAINDDCEESSLALQSDMYKFKPGPVAVMVRVSGALPGQELVDAGLLSADEVEDPAALVDYCVAFTGPPVVLRSGENIVVVPIAGLADVQAAGVDPAGLGCL